MAVEIVVDQVLDWCSERCEYVVSADITGLDMDPWRAPMLRPGCAKLL